MIYQSLEKFLNKKASVILSTLRQGDKLHEQLIEIDEYPFTRLERGVYIIDGLKDRAFKVPTIKPFFSNQVLMSQNQLDLLLEGIVKNPE